MLLNRSYTIEKENAIRALEEVADLFLKREYQREVTFQGRTLEQVVEPSKEQWPAKYWFGNATTEDMDSALAGVAGQEGQICSYILNAAFQIKQQGFYLSSSESTAGRFSFLHLTDRNCDKLAIDPQLGVSKQYEVGGNDFWHLHIEFDNNRLNIHFADNSSVKETTGFFRLYDELLGNIFKKYVVK